MSIKYSIARYVGETTLNGVEYLLNEHGLIMIFDGEDSVHEFLKEHGIDIENVIVEEVS